MASSESVDPVGTEAKTGEITSLPAAILLRHEWYQTEAHVIVSILLRGLKPVNASVDVQESKVSFESKFESNEETSLLINLFRRVDPSKSTWKQTASKVEIKLKKSDEGYWNKLEADPNDSATSKAAYPSSSLFKRDWDKLEVDLKKMEEEEQKTLSGDSAVNSLFQKIYAEGSEEVKRAMNKSFMESGGTVLSTNWKEISEKKVNVQPPEGMEFKKWE
ncbi:Cochaperone protein [Chamberlinius hualienensis]